MADSKVSALTEKTTLDGTEEILINDAGTSKKSSVTNVLAVSPSTHVYQAPGGFNGWGTASHYIRDNDVTSTAAGTGSIPIVKTGTLKNLRVEVYTNGMSSGTKVYELFVNGSGSGILINITSASGTALLEDLVNTAAVTKGDTLAFHVNGTGSVGTIAFGYATCEVE